jgi:hypothetical protein
VDDEETLPTSAAAAVADELAWGAAELEGAGLLLLAGAELELTGAEVEDCLPPLGDAGRLVDAVLRCFVLCLLLGSALVEG